MSRLKDDLGRIARATNLIKLTRPLSQAADEKGKDAAVDVEIVMRKHRSKEDLEGEEVLWQKGGVTFTPGDWVSWKVKNRGKEHVDISILFVNGAYGIIPLYPGPTTSGENRWEPGKTEPFKPIRINARTVGLEHLVLIAVKGEGAAIDFTYLAQPTLKQAESKAVEHGKERGKAFSSPLGKLFQTALYAHGNTRGEDSEAMDSCAMRLISWRVLPPKKGSK
jgi:hypothetical protein